MDFSDTEMKEVLLGLGFDFIPFKVGREVQLPITEGSYGLYQLNSKTTNLIAKIEGTVFTLRDGRPTVDKVYYQIDDLEISTHIDLIVEVIKEFFNNL